MIYLPESFVIDACISSSVRPLVAGTRNVTNATPAAHMTQNIENVPARVANTEDRGLRNGKCISMGDYRIPVLLHSIMKWNVNVTAQLQF